MSYSIGSNVLSLSVRRHLAYAQAQGNVATERLSSGKRVNSARDDAAGIAVSSRLGVRSSGLTVGLRNVNEAVSLLQISETALDDASRALLRLRELALQSANGGYGPGERQSLQQEGRQILDEVARLASQTRYGGQNLLDGQAGMLEFQLGSAADEQFRLEGLPDIRLSSLGSGTLLLDGRAMGRAAAPAASMPPFGLSAPEPDLVFETALGGATAPITIDGEFGASQIRQTIESNAGLVGISAEAYSRATLSRLSAPGTVSFKLGVSAVPISATILDTNDLTSLVDSINAAGSGLRASFANPGDRSAITLDSMLEGHTIHIQDFASDAAGNQTIRVAGERGSPVTLTEGGADSTSVVGLVTLTSTMGPITVRNANPDMFTATESGSLAALSIDTVTAAGKALDILDGALTQLGEYRAKVGAWRNRLDSVANSLATGADALDTARSRVEDADYAAETGALVRSQILQQAATAMVAQANLGPTEVLKLLRAQ